MKKLLFTTFVLLFSISLVQAQNENNKENLLIKLKEGEKPTIYIDGKVFDFPLELLDQSKFESVIILKGKEAIAKYNEPNGVILIKTNVVKQFDFSNIKVREHLKEMANKNYPKVIIDGKVADKETLDKLSPDSIDKMNVIKGKVAIEKHDAPNGVIIITTKKM
jgi:hypothetical protein